MFTLVPHIRGERSSGKSVQMQVADDTVESLIEEGSRMMCYPVSEACDLPPDRKAATSDSPSRSAKAPTTGPPVGFDRHGRKRPKRR